MFCCDPPSCMFFVTSEVNKQPNYIYIGKITGSDYGFKGNKVALFFKPVALFFISLRYRFILKKLIK